jgi:cysteine desulfuration protein SufE
MISSFLQTLNRLKNLKSTEQLYQELIIIGKSSPHKASWDFLESDKVLGCQSLLYIRCSVKSGKLSFEFFCDALISAGLAALLIQYYSEMDLKQMLQSPPQFLNELNMGHLLSPGRSNGINSLYKKMIQLALATYTAH